MPLRRDGGRCVGSRAMISRTQSLNEVRAVIPATCYERSGMRASLAIAQAVLLYLLPVVGLALTDRWWALLVLWPLAGLGVAGLFVLGHDASHGALVESNRVNKMVARACMVPRTPPPTTTALSVHTARW